MSLSDFLARLSEIPMESGRVPFGFAALAELSGLSAEEAGELARTWDEWPAEHVRALFQRLAGLAEEHTDLEFEVVFKAGLVVADAEVRLVSVTSLAESADRTLAARFADLLGQDRDPRVRAAAAASMATLCAIAAEGKLPGRGGERMRVALLRALEDRSEDAEVQMRALETAALFGGAQVSSLIEDASRSGDERVRQSAMFAMGRTSDARWLPSVLAELDGVSAALRYEATVALGEIGGEGDSVHLAGPLDDSDLDVQLAAVASLGRIGGEAATRMLRQAVRSSEPSVREAAQAALEALEIEQGLSEPVGPEMRRRGGMFGGAAHASATGGFGADIPDEEYDAASSEGWGRPGQNGDARAGSGHGDGAAGDEEDEG
jgi:hypothetical protein